MNCARHRRPRAPAHPGRQGRRRGPARCRGRRPRLDHGGGQVSRYAWAPGYCDDGDRPQIVTSRFQYEDGYTLDRYLATP